MTGKATYDELAQRVNELEKEVVEPKPVEELQKESDGPIIANKLVIIISGILILLGLYLSSIYNYLLFHSIAEIFSIIIACSIFIVAWNSRRFLDSNYLLFLGIAYLFIAALDLIHTLSYTGMGIFKGYGTNLPTQLWIAARFMESLSLLIAPLFFERALRIRLIFAIYIVAFFFLVGSVFWNIFPSCFVEGTGLTLFKKSSEYIISLILFGSIFLLFQKRKRLEAGVFRLIVASILVTVGSEFAFTFYVHVYGFSNLVGHYFKIISFYLIYKAIIETGLVKPYSLLFRNLWQSENALREERSFAEGIINTAQVIILVLDIKGRIVRFNSYMEELSGYSLDEVQGKDWFTTFLFAKDNKRIRDLFQKAVGDIQTRGNVNSIVTKDGSECQIEWYDKTLKDANGNVTGLLAIGLDVTERKQTEEKIKASLKEKEILLQEIHHRVKNNMQIISSLLKLQASNVGDERVTDALMECRGRVQTMAFVHETLYGSDTLAVIDFKTYISKLAIQIFQTYKTSMDRVKLKVDAEDIKLGIEQATPIGLITNELVSNSLKYAFPENRSGEIVIRIRPVEQDSIEFVFSDNGIGITEDLDWRNTDSLGLRLVIILAEDQLDGTLSLDRGKGTHFTVRFRHEENQ